MGENTTELGWTDILKMSDEVRGAHGPGSRDWRAEGSEAQRVNALYMKGLRENQGKMPGELGAIPSIIITTKGAKTGEPRDVPLAYQIIDGRLVIVASMGGADRHPPWYHNLVAHPEVLVELNGETFKATAVVTSGADRSYLYDQVAEALPAFKEYAARTSRVIPVVELKRHA